MFAAATRTLTFAAALGCALGLLGCGGTPKSEPPQPAVPSARAEAEPKPAAPAAAPSPSTAVAEPAVLADVETALAYDDADPLADLEAADALDRMGKAEPLAKTKAPKGGCVVLDPGRRVWQSSGSIAMPVAIAALRDGFAVAGYARKPAAADTAGAAGVEREQVYLVAVPAEALPKPIASFDLKAPHPLPRLAPPGLAARTEDDVVIAFTDGARTLRSRRMRMGQGGSGASVELAQNVDTRFSPALTTSQDRTLIAFTLGGTPMRTTLAVLAADGNVTERKDLTPASMGAAAPAFIAGATPPVLLMLDARNGMSPLLRVDLGSDGAAKPAEVVLPVSMVASPPEIAAASSSIGTYVAYTALGSAASSAVGLVSIAPIAGTPEALVPGTAYGQLHIAATTAPRAVLIAATAPIGTGKNPELELHVHVIGITGQGPATVLRASGGASHPAIARDEAGHVGVAFATPSGAFVAILRCDDDD